MSLVDNGSHWDGTAKPTEHMEFWCWCQNEPPNSTSAWAETTATPLPTTGHTPSTHRAGRAGSARRSKPRIRRCPMPLPEQGEVASPQRSAIVPPGNNKTPPRQGHPEASARLNRGSRSTIQAPRLPRIVVSSRLSGRLSHCSRYASPSRPSLTELGLAWILPASWTTHLVCGKIDEPHTRTWHWQRDLAQKTD